MSGELVSRRQGGGRQLERRVSGAINNINAKQAIAERAIKAQSEVGEYAAYEASYLVGVAGIVAATNPAAAPAVDAIVKLTLSGIIRNVADFGSSL